MSTAAHKSDVEAHSETLPTSSSASSSSALSHHPLDTGPLSLSNADAANAEDDDSGIRPSFSTQGTIRGFGTIRASKGSTSASQARPGYFDLQRLAAEQSEYNANGSAFTSITASGSGNGNSNSKVLNKFADSVQGSSTGSTPSHQKSIQRTRSNSRAGSVYSNASSSRRLSIDRSHNNRESDDRVETLDDNDEGSDDLPSWLHTVQTVRARSPHQRSSFIGQVKPRPITQVLDLSNSRLNETPIASSTHGKRQSVSNGGDLPAQSLEEIEAQLKTSVEEAERWKRACEEQTSRHARELLALQKASEAREAALMDILTAAGISKARAERALTHATAQSQVPVFRADERLSEHINRTRSPLPSSSASSTLIKHGMSPKRSLSSEDQLPASIMEAMLDDFQADLHYHQSQMDQSRPPSVFSESRPQSPAPSIRSTISRATQAASSVTSVNGFFTTLNWRRKKSPAIGQNAANITATREGGDVTANERVRSPALNVPSVDATATLSKALDKNRRRSTSSKYAKQSEPNLTRLPGLFGQRFGGQIVQDAEKTDNRSQSLTQELEPMLAHDLRPPALTLAARKKRTSRSANVQHLQASLLPDDAKFSESEAVAADDEYQSSGDEFEVYGGKHLTPEELAERVSMTIKKQREAGAEDSILTDRYGFVYDATPADVRLLRRARKEASHAPACLTGIRVGVRARGGTDSQSEDEKEDGDIRANASDSDVDASTPGLQGPPPCALSTLPDFLDVPSSKPLVSASTLTAASQSSSGNGPTSPEQERLHFLAQNDASQAENERATANGNTLTTSKEKRPPNTSQTVRRLLAQLQDMHAHQQEEQQMAWDAFLQRRKLALREKSEATAAAMSQHNQQSTKSGAGMANVVNAVRRKGDSDPAPAEEEWTLGGLVGLGQMGNGTRDQQDFRKLVQGGIPLVYRPKIWYECSGAIERAEPGRYEELLKEHEHEENTCTKQIDLDVGRTMPTNIYFAGDGPGVAKLRRLLVAYLWYNPKCGYCQGMNNLAATLLLTHATEEEAFWVLACIVENVLPEDYFTSHLLVAQADQRVLIDLVREHLPKLGHHIDDLGVDLPAVTFAWFLSLYTDCLPVETLFRVWDVLFVEGMTLLFRVAVAIFTQNEREMLSTESASSFYSLMHSMTSHLFSADKLITTACEDLRTTIKAEKIDERRTQHLQDLCAELGLDFASTGQRTPSSSSIQQQV